MSATPAKGTPTPSVAALAALRTPSLLLDEAKMMRNIRRLADHAKALNVILRPHMKTAKSVEVARRLSDGVPGPITVSTLAEAEIFHEAGYTDILYAVGIAPAKLDRVKALRGRGCDLTVILDFAEQARAVAAAGGPRLSRSTVMATAAALLPVSGHWLR